MRVSAGKRSYGEYTALKGVKCGGQAEPGMLDPASASSAAQFSALA